MIARVRKRNYASDKRHAMILVSWIETFIFIRGVIIQMKPLNDVMIFLTIDPADNEIQN